MRLAILVLVSVIMLTGCAAQDGPSAVSAPYAFTGPVGSNVPVLAETPGGTLYLSWVEAVAPGHVLKLASMAPGETTWSAPREIARDTSWFVNWADVPGVMPGPDGKVLAYWLERNGTGTYTYGVRYAVSSDAGYTWSSMNWLHDDRSPSEHGFVSGVTDADGWQLAWLDGNQHAKGTPAMALHSRHVAWDGTLGEEKALDNRVCDCCPIAMIPSGVAPLVFYRDRSDAEIRDIYLAAADGSQPLRALDGQGWEIAGCPVNGPAARTHASTAAVAWFTGAQQEPRVLTAFSADGGNTFGETMRIDQGQPIGRVAVAFVNGTAYAAWLETTDANAETTMIMMQALTADGLVGQPIAAQRVSGARASGYPRLAAHDGTLLLAWTDVDADGKTRVRVAPVEL
ncbi:MAG: sialidase family protein [Bacteroidota bacterium]